MKFCWQPTGERGESKPEPPPPPPAGGEGDPEAELADAKAKPRPGKEDLFPRNLPVVVEVEASPGDFVEIGEEHHDEIEAALLTPAQLAEEIRALQPVPSGRVAVARVVRAA